MFKICFARVSLFSIADVWVEIEEPSFWQLICLSSGDIRSLFLYSSATMSTFISVLEFWSIIEVESIRIRLGVYFRQIAVSQV